LKIEYDEGYEEVYACPGDVGVSIGCRIPSSSEEAKSLRAELYAIGASAAGGLKSAAA
jgi:hypothetical protein